MARRPKPTPEAATLAQPLTPDVAILPQEEDKGASSRDAMPPAPDVKPVDEGQASQPKLGEAQVSEAVLSTPLEDAQIAEPVKPAQPAPVITRPSYFAVLLLALVTGAGAGAGAGAGLTFIPPHMMPAFIAPPPAPAMSYALSDKVTALGAAIEAQAKREASLREEITTLTARMAEARQSNAPQAAASSGETARLSALDAQLANMTQKNTTFTALSLAGAQLAATERLGSLLEKGAPLAPMLETVSALGFSADKLAAFAPFAQTGAPGFAVLRADFTAIRANMLQAQAAQEKEAVRARAQAEAEQARNAPPPANWQEALTAKAGALYEKAKQKTLNLINIRNKGDKPASATPPDMALEEAIARGDLPAAITALDARPEAERAAYAALRSKFEARLKASQAAQALTTEAEAALRAASRSVSQ